MLQQTELLSWNPAFALSPEVWLSIILGAVVTLIIAYIIYKIQKREAGEHLQKHEERFDELKRLHEQDSEKIKVLYELILKSQNGSLGEVEAEALEEQIEEAADAITEDDSHQAQALKAIAGKDKEAADNLLAKIAQQEHDLEELYNLHAMNEFRHGNYADATLWLRKLTDLKPDNNDYQMRYFGSLSEGGHFREAEEHCLKMLDKLRSASPVNEEYLSDWLYSMGQVQFKLNHIDEAESYYQQALNMGIRAYGADNFELANTYNDMGSINMHRGNPIKAEEYFKKALSIKKNVDDQDAVNTAYMTCNLASAYKMQNRLDEAEQLYIDGMRTFIERMGDEHPALTYYYHNLGQMYYYQNKPEAARHYSEKAVAIFENKHLTDHPGYFYPVGLLAKACAALEQYPEADIHYRKAIDLAKANFGEESQTAAGVLYGYGMLCQDMKQFEKAESLIQKTLSIELKDPSVGKFSLSKTYSALCLSRISLHKYAEAEQDIRAALALIADAADVQDFQRAEYQAILARILLETGHPAEADTLLSTQLPALENSPPAAKTYLNALQLKADICEALGRTAEAAQVQARIHELSPQEKQ